MNVAIVTYKFYFLILKEYYKVHRASLSKLGCMRSLQSSSVMKRELSIYFLLLNEFQKQLKLVTNRGKSEAYWSVHLPNFD